jgi:hypothetical protein
MSDNDSASSDASMLSNVLGSAAASIVARACTHPLDTIKARLQASNTCKGPMDAFVKTVKSEGISGLFRGFGAVIMGGTPGTMLYLCSYEVWKANLSTISKEHDFIVHFSSGMLAETIACVVYVPVDVVKERMQVQSYKHVVYKNSMDALFQIMRSEGLRGIYKGYAATLASFGPFSALYFMFYEQFKQYTRQYLANTNDLNDSLQGRQPLYNIDIPFHYTVMTSCSAGALASWLTSPLDMAKLRLQIQRGKMSNTTTTTTTTRTFQGVIDCLSHAYKQGGVHGLFRGAGARVLHFAPATTITMSSYEMFRSYFDTRIQ